LTTGILYIFCEYLVDKNRERIFVSVHNKIRLICNEIISNCNFFSKELFKWKKHRTNLDSKPDFNEDFINL